MERHAIAHRLGFKTVSEMENTLSQDDFDGWRDYFKRMEPRGE